MYQFFVGTPFSFSLTEPHERNYVNQINPCKMLQQLGVCGICLASATRTWPMCKCHTGRYAGAEIWRLEASASPIFMKVWRFFFNNHWHHTKEIQLLGLALTKRFQCVFFSLVSQTVSLQSGFFGRQVLLQLPILCQRARGRGVGSDVDDVGEGIFKGGLPPRAGYFYSYFCNSSLIQPILKSFWEFVKEGLIHHSVSFVLRKYELEYLKKNKMKKNSKIKK